MYFLCVFVTMGNMYKDVMKFGEDILFSLYVTINDLYNKHIVFFEDMEISWSVNLLN